MENKKKITFFEQYKYGPITKLINYGIFPYIFIIHILLLLFSILQSLSITSGTPQYDKIYNLKTINSLNKIIYSLFLNDQDKKSIILYTPNQLRDHIKNCSEYYYNIDKFVFYENIKHNKKPIIFFEFLFFSKNLHKNKSMLAEDFIKFDNKELKRKLLDVKFFTINYTITFEKENRKNIINLSTKYDFSSRGEIKVSLIIESYVKKFINNKSLMDKFYDNFIHFCVLLLSILSLLNTWKHISKISEKFVLSKKIHSEQSSKSSSIINLKFNKNVLNESSIYYNPLFDSKLIDLENESEEITDNENKNVKNASYIYSYLQWSLICLIGNIFQIIGTLIFLLTNKSNYIYVIGIGVFFSCFNMTRYIIKIKSFNSLYIIIKKTFPIIINYLIGVFPIWLAFLFLGVCIFWECKYFRNITVTIRTLLSLMFGDDIALILTDLYTNRNYFVSVFGFIYGLTFISIEIMVILNIFIEIIHQGFENEKGDKENKNNENKKNDDKKKEKEKEKEKEKNLHIIKTPSINKTKSFRSLISKRLLVNKNKEMSLNIKKDDYFQNYSYGHKKKAIERSLKSFSLGVSILEKDDERSYSSSSEDSPERRKMSRKLSKDMFQIYIEKINQIFDNIGESFNNIKDQLDLVENIFSIKKSMLSELKIVKKNLLNIKQQLMKNK